MVSVRICCTQFKQVVHENHFIFLVMRFFWSLENEVLQNGNPHSQEQRSMFKKKKKAYEQFKQLLLNLSRIFTQTPWDPGFLTPEQIRYRKPEAEPSLGDETMPLLTTIAGKGKVPKPALHSLVFWKSVFHSMRTALHNHD